jgi:endonuclease/exonuclease/phosphatase (EEP) superfamily protein YafD
VLAQAAAAHPERPMIMAGDFNAVDDHGPMLALRRLGLKSATDVAGAGWLPTWPANRTIPPLIPIDHVMISAQLTATSVRPFAVDGTDHLGLITTLAGTR